MMSQMLYFVSVDEFRRYFKHLVLYEKRNCRYVINLNLRGHFDFFSVKTDPSLGVWLSSYKEKYQWLVNFLPTYFD